jgi:hypothetical protein
LKTLRERFGESSKVIQRLLFADTWRNGKERGPEARRRAALDLDTLTPKIRSPQQIALDAPQVNPDDPDSAALGTLL